MSSGITTYFESGILSADPVELVRMLYRAAIDAVEQAREHLRNKDIAARSAQITKAGAILAHLAFSVNSELDPALGRNLTELYDYMQRRLVRANLDQADGPMAEVSRLLSTLLEGWAQCGPAESAPPVKTEADAAGYGGTGADFAPSVAPASEYGGAGYRGADYTAPVAPASDYARASYAPPAAPASGYDGGGYAGGDYVPPAAPATSYGGAGYSGADDAGAEEEAVEYAGQSWSF